MKKVKRIEKTKELSEFISKLKEIANKKCMVINTFGEKPYHDYDIITEDMDSKAVKYTLLASNSSIWSENYKGKELLSLIDTGNGIKVPKNISGEIDYSSTTELFILLSYINTKDNGLYCGKIEECEIFKTTYL